MIKKIFFFCLLFLPIFSVFADDNSYQIDLIVFTHINNQAMNSENWPNTLKQPYLKNAVNPEFDPVLGLQKEADKLKQQDDYKIILHTSWQQNVTSLRDAKWIRIYGGQPYDAQGQPIQPDDNRLPTYWELNGKIKISKSNFFDIYTDLYLTIPTGSQNNIIPLRTFIMQQHRRTKLNQLNYLDHPLFGVLIKISKSPSQPVN
jgi:hypothetical protein